MLKRLIVIFIAVLIPSISNASIINQCLSQLREGHYNQAVNLGKLAVVLHSDNPNSYLCLAAAYVKKGKLKLAKEEFSIAEILSPKNQAQNIKQISHNLLK